MIREIFLINYANSLIILQALLMGRDIAFLWNRLELSTGEIGDPIITL
jgi:hypothetical protein